MYAPKNGIESKEVSGAEPIKRSKTGGVTLVRGGGLLGEKGGRQRCLGNTRSCDNKVLKPRKNCSRNHNP